MPVPQTDKGPLWIAFERFADGFKLGERISNWFQAKGEKRREELESTWRQISDEFNFSDLLPETMRSRSPVPIAGGILAVLTFLGGVILALGSGIVSMAVTPLGKVLSYRVDRKYQSYRPDPHTAWLMALRNPSITDKVKEWMRDIGLNDDQINAYELTSQQLLTAIELETLRLRGKIDNVTYLREMRGVGITEERVKMVQELMQIIPGPQDLIRMAVREAFDPAIVTKFGYNENFPTPFGEWSERLGLPREWAERYWYAHWELPSPGQVFEMLHRLRPGTTDTPVDAETVKDYLRIADIAPYWRPRLAAISYNPLTRVDVRRMFRVGVLNREDVKKAYLDLGYNDTNAERMTEFTVRFEQEEETGLGRTAITGSYQRGLITRDQARQMIIDSGNRPEIADFYLDMVDHDLSSQQTKAKLSAIRSLFINGLIDEPELAVQLGPLALPAERQRALLELWLIERESRFDLPTRAELEDFYRREIITPEQFVHLMRQRGFRPDVIEFYILRLDQEQSEASQTEIERAQKEAERVIISKRTSAYQRQRAELDVIIAEDNARIADLRMAKHVLLEPEQKEDVERQILEIKAHIAQMNLLKAQTKYNFKSPAIQ